MEAHRTRRALLEARPVRVSVGAVPSSRRWFRTLDLALFLPVLSAVGTFMVAQQAQTWLEASATFRHLTDPTAVEIDSSHASGTRVSQGIVSCVAQRRPAPPWRSA